MKSFNLITSSLLTGIILVIPISSISAKAQTEDRVVAVVNGREIRQREVDHFLMAQVVSLEEQLYAIRKTILDNLILTSVLESEAAKRGVSREKLREILTAGKVEVKLAEIEGAYAENLSVFGAMSADEAKERLRLDLESQARLAKYREAVRELREKAVIQIFLEEPRWPMLALAAGSPMLGPKKSAVTIIEFADFQCPYCRDSQSVIKEVLKANRNEVSLVFKHLPLNIHPQAFQAARASFCAGEQGRFWEYHDALFAVQDLQVASLNKVARGSNLDLAKFDLCLGSDASKAAVENDKREAERWGITSTPTFVVNGKIIRGAIDIATFKRLLEQEIKSAQLTSRSNELGPAKH